MELNRGVAEIFNQPSVRSVEVIRSNYYKAVVNGNITREVNYEAYLINGELYISRNGTYLQRDEFYIQYRDLGFSLYKYMVSECKHKCMFSIAYLLGSRQYFVSKLISI